MALPFSTTNDPIGDVYNFTPPSNGFSAVSPGPNLSLMPPPNVGVPGAMATSNENNMTYLKRGIQGEVYSINVRMGSGVVNDEKRHLSDEIGAQTLLFTKDMGHNAMIARGFVQARSVSAMNAHLDSIAGRDEFTLDDGIDKLMDEWSFFGVQQTNTDASHYRNRQDATISVFTGFRARVFDIWLWTGRVAAPNDRLWLILEFVRDMGTDEEAQAALTRAVEDIISDGHDSDDDEDDEPSRDVAMARDLLNAHENSSAAEIISAITAEINGRALHHATETTLKEALDAGHWRYRPYIQFAGDSKPSLKHYSGNGWVGTCLYIGLVTVRYGDVSGIHRWQPRARRGIFPDITDEYNNLLKKLPCVEVQLAVR